MEQRQLAMKWCLFGLNPQAESLCTTVKVYKAYETKIQFTEFHTYENFVQINYWGFHSFGGERACVKNTC